jgi:ABC-type multidrug transport system fused ATPase/permease subunit
MSTPPSHPGAGPAPSGYLYRRSWGYLPRVWPYVRRYPGLAGSSGALTITAAFVALLEPWPLALLVDGVLRGQRDIPKVLQDLTATGPVALIAVIVSIGLLISLLANGLAVLSEYINTKLQQYLALDFRSSMFEHAQRLSLTFHDRNRKGDLMGRFVFETGAMGTVPLAFPPIVQAVLTLVGMLWITYKIDPVLALQSMTFYLKNPNSPRI